MAPKKEPEAPKPVLAVEYNGVLYPCMQKAEGARAKADLMALISPDKTSSRLTDPYSAMSEGIRLLGKLCAVDDVIENAERVHGILSRYLSASAAEN